MRAASPAAIAAWRGDHYRYRGQTHTRRCTSASDADVYTPRQACWLLRRPRADLTAPEQVFLTRHEQACPQVALAAALVAEFATVLREHDVDGLYAWLRGLEISSIKEFKGIARRMWLDRHAIEAAVRLDWSNGQVEGKVNKLKVIKRAGYGRATFDLLRRRVLHAS